VAYESNEQKIESVYSKRIRAGKRRTYFFDVRATRSNDYFLTITESRKRFNDNGYDRHKIFLYKEDFNKFIKALGEAVDYVKTDLMPDFDFDAFNHDNYEENGATFTEVSETGELDEVSSLTVTSPEAASVVVVEEEDQERLVPEVVVAFNETSSAPVASHSTEEVDKW
jgi:hypothetical protein